MNKRNDIIRVRKSDLPKPLLVEDESGSVKYMTLMPAKDGKLGAYLCQMSELAIATVKRLIGRR